MVSDSLNVLCCLLAIVGTGRMCHWPLDSLTKARHAELGLGQVCLVFLSPRIPASYLNSLVIGPRFVDLAIYEPDNSLHHNEAE